MATRGQLRNELRAWIAELRAPKTINGEIVELGIGHNWTDEQCLAHIARGLGVSDWETHYSPVLDALEFSGNHRFLLTFYVARQAAHEAVPHIIDLRVPSAYDYARIAWVGDLDSAPSQIIGRSNHVGMMRP